MWPRNVANGVNKVVRPLSRAANYGGSVFLFLLMLLVVVHVIGRYLFKLPIPGAVQFIQFSMVFVVFLGLGYCAVQQGNVSVDLLVARLPRRARAIIDAITCFLSIGIVSLITWQGVIQGMNLWRSGAVSGTPQVPYFPFFIVLVFGCGVFTLVLVADFFEFLRLEG